MVLVVDDRYSHQKDGQQNRDRTGQKGNTYMPMTDCFFGGSLLMMAVGEGAGMGMGDRGEMDGSEELEMME